MTVHEQEALEAAREKEQEQELRKEQEAREAEAAEENKLTLYRLIIRMVRN